MGVRSQRHNPVIAFWITCGKSAGGRLPGAPAARALPCCARALPDQVGAMTAAAAPENALALDDGIVRNSASRNCVYCGAAGTTDSFTVVKQSMTYCGSMHASPLLGGGGLGGWNSEGGGAGGRGGGVGGNGGGVGRGWKATTLAGARTAWLRWR